jgi:hypothetical protein
MLDHHGHFFLLDQDRERLLEQRAIERAARSGRPARSWFARSVMSRIDQVWRLTIAAAARIGSVRAPGDPGPTGPLPI